jgi:cytochrome c oxidase assembly protein subunit 15
VRKLPSFVIRRIEHVPLSGNIFLLSGDSLVRIFWPLPISATDYRVRVLAVVSLIAEIVLVGTGGAVRLTGSGLGCPTWPYCTDDSLVTTPAMGIHGIVEFVNRLLAVVITVIAIAAFLAVIRFRKERRDLFVLTLLQGLSIPVQAVLGGITVLTGLNPYVVGAHFVVSILLVVDVTILVWRVYRGPRTSSVTVPLWMLVAGTVAAILTAVTVVFGILTTGSGPHAGDPLTPRNGLNSSTLQNIHSVPAYALFALTLLLLVGALVLRLPRRWIGILFAVELAQIVVGIIQANTALPVGLVGIHLVLAATLVAAMTAVVLSFRSPAGAREVPASAS